jgi:hypothetical protein
VKDSGYQVCTRSFFLSLPTRSSPIPLPAMAACSSQIPTLAATTTRKPARRHVGRCCPWPTVGPLLRVPCIQLGTAPAGVHMGAATCVPRRPAGSPPSPCSLNQCCVAACSASSRPVCSPPVACPPWARGSRVRLSRPYPRAPPVQRPCGLAVASPRPRAPAPPSPWLANPPCVLQ